MLNCHHGRLTETAILWCKMKYYLANKTLKKKLLSTLQRDTSFDPVLKTKALKCCKRMCVCKVQTKQTRDARRLHSPTADTTYNLAEIVLPSPKESNLTKRKLSITGKGSTQSRKRKASTELYLSVQVTVTGQF